MSGRGLLAGACALLVLYAGLAKALLFRNLEYWSNDLFSFLELSWSWHYAGRLLYDNAYGDHTAIHNFWLLPLLSPLTIPLGAYGLFLALIAAYLLAALVTARSEALDLSGRLALSAGLLGPLGYYVFDNPGTGFHPELLYPPLATLLALALAASRYRAAVLAVAAILLVKEDGAVLCAALLVAWFAARLWTLRGGSASERQRVLRPALLSLAAVSLVFLLGMAALHRAGQRVEATQTTYSSHRVTKSVRILQMTLAGEARPPHAQRLKEGLLGYAGTVALLLLPLGRRLPRGLSLVLLSAAPVVLVITISAALYRFELMMWPPRLAVLVALVLACVVFASSAPRAPASTVTTAALVLVSCGLQLWLLGGLGYRIVSRLDLPALVSGDGYVRGRVPPSELTFLSCVAARLPGGLPIAVPRDVQGIFHRQSLVLEGVEGQPWHPPRLRVATASAVHPEEAGFCAGPGAGRLVVTAECELLPPIEACGQEPPGPRG